MNNRINTGSCQLIIGEKTYGATGVESCFTLVETTEPGDEFINHRPGRHYISVKVDSPIDIDDLLTEKTFAVNFIRDGKPLLETPRSCVITEYRINRESADYFADLTIDLAAP